MKFKRMYWLLIPFIVEMWKTMRVTDFVFGSNWKLPASEGQEMRITDRVTDYFMEWKEDGVPMPWTRIALYCLMAWSRDRSGLE